MAFVSWAAEKTQVENQISDLNAKLAMKSLSGPDRQVVQRDLGELTKYYDWLCSQVNKADRAASGRGRMHVVNFG